VFCRPVETIKEKENFLTDVKRNLIGLLIFLCQQQERKTHVGSKSNVCLKNASIEQNERAITNQAKQKYRMRNTIHVANEKKNLMMTERT